MMIVGNTLTTIKSLFFTTFVRLQSSEHELHKYHGYPLRCITKQYIIHKQGISIHYILPCHPVVVPFRVF